MRQFTYVEEYLEFLAGYEPHPPNQWTFPEKLLNCISLARYDVAIVQSIANSTMFGIALTDRQAELIRRLVLKYKRQFARNGIDVSPIETPQYRIPIRSVDRTYSISIDDDHIIIKFPYNKELIAQLQKYKTDSQGAVEWDTDKKVWHLAITEYNVNWCVSWGKSTGFVVSDDVQQLFQLVLQSESVEYSIKLVKADQGYTITNATTSLIDYIQAHLGGWDNVDLLVDYSGILGYIVSEEISCSNLINRFGRSQTHRLTPTIDNLDTILDYAIASNRFPLMIYHPNLTIEISDKIYGKFDHADIVHIDMAGRNVYGTNMSEAKVIIAERFPKTNLATIPLLVTYHELLHGSNKQRWLCMAERVVYLCPSIITK